MYQALYRKWRPQTFDEVIGQEHITETLKSQVIHDRLSHAYIFIGTRGTGKTTCARILARAVNCEHPVNGNPCGVCDSCRGISDGTILDVVELDAASNNGVDNVRALREEAVFSPAAAKKRVYIIDEVHMLTQQAFNALLKILEEPPEHLMFILATTELHRVPATILSRCQRHSFRRIDSRTLSAYLEKVASAERLSLSHGAAELIARLAEGGVRDALSLLDQCASSTEIDVDHVYACMGLAGKRRIAQMLDHILKHETAKTLREFDGMWMDGKAPASLLSELGELLRDILMMHVAPGTAMELASGSYDSATLNAFAKRLTTEEILAAMTTLQNAQLGLREVRSPKTAAELCLVSLCEDAAGDGTASLRARISRLEEQIARGAAPERSRAEEIPFPEEEREAPPEEEEELDPELFPEEQPEDDLPTESAPAEAPEQAEAPADSGELWRKIFDQATASMLEGQRVALDDLSQLRGRIEGDVLKLEAAPGFVYGQVNRQDVLTNFALAARKLTGREVRAVLSEMKPDSRPRRSLDELRQFKEVHFDS